MNMRAALLAAVVLIALPVAAADAPARGTVRGIVKLDKLPLPAVEVELWCGGTALRTVTDAEGEYVMRDVPPGRCLFQLTMDSFERVERTLTVTPGINDAGADAMKLTAVPEELTLSCGRPTCSDEPPTKSIDVPLCSEFELNSSLIEARTTRNDLSALTLLETRLRLTVSQVERHRIAAALLGTRADAEAWKLLSTDAEIAVRFPQPEGLNDVTPEFKQWCDERGLDEVEYRWVVEHAFICASADKRAHELLVKALATDDVSLMYDAVCALALQHDEASLPLIAEALKRVTDSGSKSGLAFALAEFRSDAADALAFQYLDPSVHQEYLASRTPQP